MRRLCATLAVLVMVALGAAGCGGNASIKEGMPEVDTNKRYEPLAKPFAFDPKGADKAKGGAGPAGVPKVGQ